MGNGPLGGNTNPGISDGGTLARMLNLPPGTLSFSMPSWAEVENRARHAAHKLVNAVSTTDTSTAIDQLLGQQSFTAGIVYGMCANLAGSVWQLAKLFKTLALAVTHGLRSTGLSRACLERLAAADECPRRRSRGRAFPRVRAD